MKQKHKKLEACSKCGAYGCTTIVYAGDWLIGCYECNHAYYSKWLWLAVWRWNHARRKQLRMEPVNDASRAYTKKESRALFMSCIRSIVSYWKRQDTDCDDKLDNCTLSILNLLDGGNVLPAFDLHLAPNPDDKAFAKEEKSNWFEIGLCINKDESLHEEYYLREEKDPAT